VKNLLEMLKQEGYVPSQAVLDVLKQDCEMFHKLGYDAGYADAKASIANYLEEICIQLRAKND
jgi:hypothetical protein